MGLLIVYCLRGVSVVHGSHGLPELIALAAVTASYLWKRNTIFSVIIGTVLYMFLLQMVFSTGRSESLKAKPLTFPRKSSRFVVH